MLVQLNMLIGLNLGSLITIFLSKCIKFLLHALNRIKISLSLSLCASPIGVIEGPIFPDKGSHNANMDQMALTHPLVQPINNVLSL